jgi:hypothetical protein
MGASPSCQNLSFPERKGNEEKNFTAEHAETAEVFLQKNIVPGNILNIL